MLLNALVERLKRRSKNVFKGRHYEASLILQAVSWYLRYPLSYRDIEEMLLSVAPRWTTPVTQRYTPTRQRSESNLDAKCVRSGCGSVPNS